MNTFVLPSNFPLLPLRNGVLFPGTIITLPIGRERSVQLVKTLRKGDVIGVVTQKDPKVADPGEADLNDMGTFARVSDIARVSGGEYRLVLEGLGRMTFLRLTRTEPFWTGEGVEPSETNRKAEEAVLLAKSLEEHVKELSGGGGPLAQVTGSEDDPGIFADRIAATLGLATDKEMRVLVELDVIERLKLVAGLLGEAKAATDMKRKIEADVRQKLGQDQREALLREQLRAIKKELGEDNTGDEIAALRERLEKAGLPTEAKTIVDRELKRLSSLQPQQAEHNVIRTYLEWFADLPWSSRAEVKDDIDAVAKKLDDDHYGLEDVKKRILEHMAVLKLAGTARGSILCFAGPPGVGKTSLGQSIADATGRPFMRIALGGVRDEAEVRGHRRTYVGALPGRILNAMRKAKVKNPVLLLDEIDKLAVGWMGSPESALLEVLDPEQNKTFTDHYLETPFDLSEVLFICTANDLANLSAPLRDRLEIIEISGYTVDEKVHIAKKHLVPKQLKEHAIHESSLTISDGALSSIIRDYTREAGVRQLTREVTKLCRALALEVARSKDAKPTLNVDDTNLGKYLGKIKFFGEVAERTSVAGVATGLAWTPVGGDILFIETTKMPGKGQIEITGQLGDVMKESAKAALSYVKSHFKELEVDVDVLKDQDLHIHVPQGAVPKDGPSAGVTMFTALTSLLSGRRVRNDTAMTGEVTLRGRVLPVGGIKAKVLAAHRAGITRVILPKKNERDMEDVPKEAREAMEFIFAEDMAQVIAAALEETPALPASGKTGQAGADTEVGTGRDAVH
ncbi:MAG: endopeptidase La [Polyangiaceae bacterium]|nr:endopeptidase La [Polyangiaceae bacterium]